MEKEFDLFDEDVFSQCDNFAEILNYFENNTQNNGGNSVNIDTDPSLSEGIENARPNIVSNLTKKKFTPPVKKNTNNTEVINLPIQYDSKDKNYDMQECTMGIDDLNQSNPANIIDETFEKRNKCEPITKLGLNGLLLGSLNVLNDVEDNLFQTLFNNSQEQEKTSQESKNTVLSKSESFNSVVSLNKTYKDLDNKSLETIHRQEDAFLNSQSQSVFLSTDCNNHKIPTGDDFLNLFKGGKSIKPDKMVPLATEVGDIGLNVYFKDEVIINEEIDTSEVVSKILDKYPKENKISMKNQFKL